MKKVEKKGKNFSLCCFCDYNVEYSCKYCYLNEDGDFSDNEVKQSFQVDGGKLMDSIAKLILSCDCINFTILENQVLIEHFNPHTGETSDYDYKIREVPLSNIIEKRNT